MLGGLRSRRAASTWASADELKTERALNSLRGKLSVKRVGSSHIILIAFKDSDPNKAANIVNEIAQASLRDVQSITEAAHSGSMGLREHIKDLGPSARIISAAAPPIHRDGPTGLLIAAAATVLGFGLGAGIALLKVSTDRTIRTPGQARSLVGADCLGLIPRIGKGFLARFQAKTRPNRIMHSWRRFRKTRTRSVSRDPTSKRGNSRAVETRDAEPGCDGNPSRRGSDDHSAQPCSHCGERGQESSARRRRLFRSSPFAFACAGRTDRTHRGSELRGIADQQRSHRRTQRFAFSPVRRAIRMQCRSHVVRANG